MARAESAPRRVRRWAAGEAVDVVDDVAGEEPLQLMVNGSPLSVVMRTPGHDRELALGLLWAESVIRSYDDVATVTVSAEDGGSILDPNVVDVSLRSGADRLPQRSFLSSSACGVCGATTLESLARDFPAVASDMRVKAALLPVLAERLREEQRLFDTTGGLHAAGLFDARGTRVVVREDVGRHNAVDKVVGNLFLRRSLPASASILVVSGRLGYEVVQKAVAAGIPVLVGVGAASSLAAATAERFRLTLAGFLRGDRFNVYSAPERVVA